MSPLGSPTPDWPSHSFPHLARFWKHATLRWARLGIALPKRNSNSVGEVEARACIRNALATCRVGGREKQRKRKRKREREEGPSSLSLSAFTAKRQ